MPLEIYPPGALQFVGHDDDDNVDALLSAAAGDTWAAGVRAKARRSSPAVQQRLQRNSALVRESEPDRYREYPLGFDSGATLVAAAGTSIVTTAAISCDDNSIIYRLSTAGGIANTGEWGKSNEPMGLLGLIDDGTYVGTYYNLSRTTYPQLKSRVHASVGALSLDALQLNFDIAHQLGDGEIAMLAGHHSTKRAYLALLEADRRYTGSDLQAPDGGTKAAKRGQYVTFAGVPFVDSKHAPYGMIFGIDKKDFHRYVQIDGEWANESGAILRQDTGKDTWTAFWRVWENYFLARPNTCFRMEGVTSTTVYVASY